MARTRTLHDAFLNELRDVYDAEQQVAKALPKIIEATRGEDLRMALQAHLTETEGHVARLEQVFASLNETPKREHCEGMAGIIDEGNEVMKHTFDEATADACIIAACQRVEHYEMAAYGTVIAWAQAMGHTTAQTLLQQSLDEEKRADKKLSALAEGGINQRAAQTAHV